MNKDIDVHELKKKMDNQDEFIFIDVRESYEYEEANLGAKLIPLGIFPLRIEELRDHQNAEIVIHCRSGARSGMAKQILLQNGFSNVRNLLGGILEWDMHYKI